MTAMVTAYIRGYGGSEGGGRGVGGEIIGHLPMSQMVGHSIMIQVLHM